MTARDKRLERAQMRTLFNAPFFAPGVAKLPVVWDETIETACTNGEEIRWNPVHFDEMKDGELVTVLCHEVAHCLLGHIWRAPSGCNPIAWNHATDYAINDMLADFGKLVTARNLADPFPMPEGCLVGNPAFKGLSEEVIYSRLMSQPPAPAPQQGQGKGKSNGSGTSKGAGQVQKSPISQPGANAGQVEHKPFGEFKPANKGQATNKKFQNDWESTLLQSVAAMKSRGEVPGSVNRFVGELMNPQVPWYEVLRSVLREFVNDDWDWRTPDPLMDGSGFILPSLLSERMGAVIFATDTSGSIDGKLLAQFQAEKQSCLDELHPVSIMDICCDATITQVREYRPGDVLDKSAPGGGGTDFTPVFSHIAKLQEQPKCLVYLTDLYGSFPSEAPAYPVIWVVWGPERKAPFGEVIGVD